MKKDILAIGVSLGGLIMPAMAAAQDARSGAGAGLDEIVVTAQRRSESVLSVPLSITALPGEALQEAGIETLSDLKFQTPGFISQSGTGYTQLFIRGIGNIIYVGADPSVATFIDDVPRPYGSLVDNFINVDRVEVLKGAQGGLYGRNATGGVVNIITRQPSDKPEMAANITAGEFQTIEVAGYANLPIGDRVAVNISGMRRIHDPYLENLARPNPYPPGTTFAFGDPNAFVQIGKLNDADFYAVEGKLRFELGDNFSLTLAGDYSNKDDADGNGWVQRNPTLNYLAYRGLAAQLGLSNTLAPWPTPPHHSAYDGIGSYSHTIDYGGSAKLELGLEGVDLTSITAFRWNNSNFRGDIGAAPVGIAGFQTDFDRRNFYQELRAVSNGDGPLQFLAGATYYKDKIESEIFTVLLGFNIPTPNTSTVRTENYSIYGELSYDLTERLKLTGSLRYVEETKRAEFPAQPGVPFGPLLPPANVKTNQNKLLPSATLSYDLGDGTVYARYARGFKTGGVNPIVPPAAFGNAPGSTFGPEVVDAFEIGYRSSLFDRKVQVTTAIFYNYYDGLQIARAGNRANPQVTNAILNAGTARTYGAEASVSWRVVPALTLSANLGYLNAKYKQAGYPGSPVVDPFTADGNRMALAPEWQGGASLSFDQPVSDSLRVKANVLYSYVGEYNHQYEEDPLLVQEGYSLVNLRAGIATIEDNVGFYVFANNVFDQYYTIFATKNSLGVLNTEAPPRVIGGTLEIKF